MDIQTHLTNILKEEAYSANAAKVYWALLGLGSANLSQLSARTRLHPQSVKNALQELQKRGLTTRLDYKISQSLFKPAPPFTISTRIKSKYEEYAKLLPDLQKKYRQTASRFIGVYEGIDAFSRQLSELFDGSPRNCSIAIIAHPGSRLPIMLGDAYQKIERIRREKNITKLSLVNRSAVKSFRQHSDILAEPNAEYRIHEACQGPLMQIVSPLCLIEFFQDPNEPTTVVIDNKSFALQALQSFSALWKLAKKI